MTIQENVILAPYTTLRIGGPARYFVEPATEEEVLEAFAWAAARGSCVEIIGGGSNLLVPDEGFGGLVIRLAFHGLDQQEALLDVAAGESWDVFVDRAVDLRLGGVECLAGIPGSVGATPVQNVGAYGQEVAQTIESVRAYDRRRGNFGDLSAAECAFGYRKSLFNGEARGRYVISRVRFRLRENAQPFLGYADLKRWFAAHPTTPTLAEVAEAVRTIRRAKGMVLAEADQDTWSAGSYFKNPIVDSATLTHIADRCGTAVDLVPHWEASGGQVKLPAAWLLEQAGFSKGFVLGKAGISTKHALALSNRGGASFADILRLEEFIRVRVQDRFGILLEREPVVLGQDF